MSEPIDADNIGIVTVLDDAPGDMCTVDGFCGIADPALADGATEERDA